MSGSISVSGDARRDGMDSMKNWLAGRNSLSQKKLVLSFRINLTRDYLDTGLFLDHRITRGMVRAEAKDKRMLNLFCYTGSFSVYAAAGGAVQVDSVDLSKTYLNWAEANLALNCSQ